MKVLLTILLFAVACAVRGGGVTTTFTVTTNYPRVSMTLAPRDLLLLNGRQAEKRFYPKDFVTDGNYVYAGTNFFRYDSHTNLIANGIVLRKRAWDLTVLTNGFPDRTHWITDSNEVALVSVFASNGVVHVKQLQ